MNREDMLAGLVAQVAAANGLGANDLVAIRAVIEEASELGAARVLARMGLADPEAVEDLSELRQLLQAWRDAKASAWKAAVGWVVRAALALMLVGLAYRLGVASLLK